VPMAKSQISRLVCPSMDSPTIERRRVFPGRAGRHPFLILTTPGCRRTRARLPCPIAPEVRAMRSTRPCRRRSVWARPCYCHCLKPRHMHQSNPIRAGGRGTEVSECLNLVLNLVVIAPFGGVAYSQPRSAGCRCATAPICNLCNRDCVNELTKIKSSTICSIK
jgi:hypothetical protein